MKKKKILGIILSIVFSFIFFGVLAYAGGIMNTLKAFGFTALIVGGIFLCTYLLTTD